MKKLLYLAVVALLAMNFAFTSCSKDDEVDAPDSLVGTTWAFSEGGNSLTVSFPTEILYELSMSGPDIEDVDGMGFYTYSKPVVTLSLGMGDDAETMTGTVSGNKLTFTYEGYNAVLTRK